MEVQNRIMVIDDDEITRKSLKKILEEEGYETETAKTGREGVEKIYKKFFNITLLDIKLPDVEGTELLIPLKEMHPDMNIIMITGHSEIDSAIKALNRGAAAYILKPLDIDSLLGDIRGFIEKQYLIAEKRQVKRELKESFEDRKELENIINKSPAVVFLWKNKEGWPVEYVSENIKQFGYTPEEFYSGELPYSNIIHPDDLERVAAEVNMHSIEGVQEFEQEYRIITKNNDVCWIDDHTWIRRNQKGEITHYQGIILDITEKKETEEKLRKSEKKYRELFENAPDGISIVDSKGYIIDCNMADQKLIGYDYKEMVGKHITTFFKDDNKAKFKQKFPILKKIGSIEAELILVRKDGGLIPISRKVSAIYNDNGNFFGEIVHSRDNTARKKAEVKLKISETKLKILNKELEQNVEERTKELKESEERYKNIINNISDVLMEGNIDGTITFVSPQIYDINGYHPKELIGFKFFEFIHPEEKKIYGKLINEPHKAGYKFSFELRALHKKGYYVPISLRGSLEEANEKLEFFIVIRDITEKRKIDNMMKSEIKKLKDLDQIRSDLIRRISHELKTPLISIFSGSQYLLDQSNDIVKDQTQRIIQLIHMGGYRLKSLVDNLILTYNIESKELNLNLKRKNIIQIIKNCIEDIVFQAKKRKIFINIELLKELYIEVDNSMIKRAISNILSNAVKNTPTNGNIFISTFEHPNYIDIIVKDDGVGLIKKEKLLLFKRFGKIERYGKGMDVDIEGAGLGLYITNEIVKLHYGEIIVKSKGRNKGSTFIIRLPIN